MVGSRAFVSFTIAKSRHDFDRDPPNPEEEHSRAPLRKFAIEREPQTESFAVQLLRSLSIGGLYHHVIQGVDRRALLSQGLSNGEQRFIGQVLKSKKQNTPGFARRKGYATPTAKGSRIHVSPHPFFDWPR